MGDTSDEENNFRAFSCVQGQHFEHDTSRTGRSSAAGGIPHHAAGANASCSPRVAAPASPPSYRDELVYKGE